MKINRRAKRFHDPYGFRRKGGSVCAQQWLVGADTINVSLESQNVDMTRVREADESRFVLSNSSIEKAR